MGANTFSVSRGSVSGVSSMGVLEVAIKLGPEYAQGWWGLAVWVLACHNISFFYGGRV